MEKQYTYVHTSLDVRIRNIHVKNHDNRSEYLVEIVRESECLTLHPKQRHHFNRPINSVNNFLNIFTLT